MTSTKQALRDATQIAFLLFTLACALGVLFSITGCATTGTLSQDSFPKGDYVFMNIASADARSEIGDAGAG